MARDLLIMVGAFVLASALAGALGASNLGTALSFGQIAVGVKSLRQLLASYAVITGVAIDDQDINAYFSQSRTR